MRCSVRPSGRAIWIGLSLLIVPGCATVERIFSPSAQPAPPPPSPTAPAPAKPVPATPPAHPPAPPVRPPVPPVPPVLTPQLGKADADRLRQETEARIQRTEQLLASLDLQRIGSNDRDTQSTIEDFIDKAKEALASADLLTAASLSEKALVLANDLASRVK